MRRHGRAQGNREEAEAIGRKQKQFEGSRRNRKGRRDRPGKQKESEGRRRYALCAEAELVWQLHPHVPKLEAARLQDVRSGDALHGPS